MKSIIKQKKSITNQIISAFVLMLVISVLSGIMFLFVASLKTQVLAATTEGANSTAYKAVNSTEAAGFQVIGYLGLVFLAIIFGALLTLVLRIILPYVNFGRSMDGF